MSERALVVFMNDTDIFWLKFLKNGFRHCFVCVEKNGLWISLDPLAHKTELLIIDIPEGFDLAEWLRSQNCTVVTTCICTPSKNKPLWPALISCVESVKRVLGLRQSFIFTPWQLFCHLQKNERI